VTGDPNRDRLIAVARELGSLVDDVVFVGGTVTGLLINAPSPRLTKDVDLVAPVDSAVAYENDVARVLRAHGWSEDDSEDAPRCRWRHTDAGIADVMSRVDAGFGFSNPWYPGALANAELVILAPDVTVRVVSVSYFLATKVQAFLGRGNGEFDFSHDMEDILTVAAGADGLVGKVNAADADVRSFLIETLARWTHPTGPLTRSARSHFPGTPAGAEEASRTLSLLREIAALPR
jgi:predicted nucleotidyltransferase